MAEYLVALGTFALIGSITPGPNNLMLMSSATNFGWKKTIPHLVGVNLGFVLMLVLVGVGLMQLFFAFPVGLVLLKVVSIMYVLFLAWKISTTSTLDKPDQSGNQQSRPMTMMQAMLFQWVNPKAWAMALIAIGAYSPPIRPLLSIAFVAVVFGLVNLPSIMVWVMLGTQLRRFFDNSIKLKVFNICTALLLVLSLIPFLFNMEK